MQPSAEAIRDAIVTFGTRCPSSYRVSATRETPDFSASWHVLIRLFLRRPLMFLVSPPSVPVGTSDYSTDRFVCQ